jgi:NADPH2:quinone reductase
MCVAHLQAATGGHGVNVVLEMVAEKNLNQDLLMLAQFGRIVVIGCRGPINFQPALTIGKEATIVGVLLSKTTTPVCAAVACATHSCVRSV